MAEILHRDRPEITADEPDQADVDHHQQREHGQRLDTAERRDDLRERRDHEGEDRGLRHAPRAETLGDPRVRRSEEHTSELKSLMRISYAVFCLKNKKNNNTTGT